MLNYKVHEAGLAARSTTIVLTALVAVSSISVAIYKEIHQHGAGRSAAIGLTPSEVGQTSADSNSTDQKLPNGLMRHVNSKYAVSFDYPTEWTIKEVFVNAKEGVAPVELAILLNFNATEDNNTAAVIEVYNKDYNAITGYFNSVYIDNAVTRTTKSEGIALGKKTTRYSSVSNTKPLPSKSENFLFAVGNKTYGFRSINEELNTQRDPGYWEKFTKAHDSLQL